MKKFTVFLLVAIVCIIGCFTACGRSQNDLPADNEGDTDSGTFVAAVSVMSINIAGQDMTLPANINTVKYPGQTGNDYSYEKRRARLDALIGEYTPDVLLLQEVNGNDWWWPHLVSNEDSFLNTFTDYTLVGRTNRVGGTDGAGGVWYDLYNQLYYVSAKFEATATGMFYLNERRTEPFSPDWHESGKYSSDDNNTCVWAVLKDKKTGVSALYASTHLKPVGSYLARKLTNYRQTVNLTDGLYSLAVRYADKGGALPIIVGGDFNNRIDLDYNYSYPHITEIAHYADAQKIAEKSDRSGTARVWGANKNATGSDGSVSDGYRIDMFFTQGVSISRYQCLNGMFLDDLSGTYYTKERIFDGSAYDLSDHLPIMIEAKIPLSERNIKAPSEVYRNTVSDNDVLKTDGESTVTATKAVFAGNDLLRYFGNGQFMRADVVENKAYGGLLRLTATESSPNVFIYFDYEELMRDKGLTAANISGYAKVRISYTTNFTAADSEFTVAVLNEGNPKVAYGENTTALVSSNTYTERTFDIKKGKNASGQITEIMFGTMAYTDDYSGVCGMFKGDCVYIKSIEFIA